jgi:hypothetical protein
MQVYSDIAFIGEGVRHRFILIPYNLGCILRQGNR